MEDDAEWHPSEIVDRIRRYDSLDLALCLSDMLIFVESSAGVVCDNRLGVLMAFGLVDVLLDLIHPTKSDISKSLGFRAFGKLCRKLVKRMIEPGNKHIFIFKPFLFCEIALFLISGQILWQRNYYHEMNHFQP